MGQNVIENFYQAFQQMDAERMASCYHQEIVFCDPAFGTLKGDHAANMWRMLIKSQQGKDFKIQYQNVNADESKGSAHWEAWYSFTPTGRKIHNKISAQFKLKDGLIIKHEDHFDLYRWSRQALGVQGLVIGWSSFFKEKLQKQTARMLVNFESKLAE